MKSILTVQPVLLLPPSGGENLARTIKYCGGQELGGRGNTRVGRRAPAAGGLERLG